ncbi:MAG: hypothetical protein H6831_04110 [Planctomycetes bacterium]|nr:hypothetical protein [Planctomycetota bacterium]
MTHTARRGAARVNVVWFIAVLVFAFIGIGLAIASNKDTENMRLERDAAFQARDAAVGKFDTEVRWQRSVKEAFGWYDETDEGSRTDVPTAVTDIAATRDAFGLDSTLTTAQQVLRESVPVYRARVRRIAELESEIATLRADVNAKAAAQSTLAAEKDSTISDLNRELTDLRQQSASRQADLEAELATVRSGLGTAESRITQLRNEMDDQQRRHTAELAAKTVRLQEMGNKLAFLREPEQADGLVLEVDEALNLAWIDLGKNDRLFRGMRFRIVDGRPGRSGEFKAMAEVTRVEADMAEVRLYEQADRFNPPVPGDVIFNPLYDPQGVRNAVFVGRFSGTYNEKELAALLSEIRVNIQPSVDKTTDYLIVGAELYFDEDGEPLEEPIQPSELEEYKKAIADGVQIVPLKQVIEYFRKSNV